MKNSPRLLALLALILSAVPSALAQPGSPPSEPRLTIEERNPWTDLDWNADPRRFQFAIVADRVGGHRPGIFEAAMAKLNLMQPEFVLCVGDLIEGYSEDPPTIRSEWAEVEGMVRSLEMPFFFVPGNHDVTNLTEVAEWQNRFGRLYYHFVYQDILFLCLDSDDPPTDRISSAQIDYVRQALQENPQVRWTLVFLHKPLWTYAQDTGWSQIEALLEGRPHTVFAGHYHTYAKDERNGSRYFILATTGGASSLQGPVYGEFDHLVWVTMTDEGPRIANLMLDGIQDEDIRTARTAAIVDQVLMGNAVALMPIWAEGQHFRGAVTQLQLTNDTDLPMRLRGQFQPDAVLQVLPTELQVTVPPKSTHPVPLTVQPLRGKVAIDGLKPLTLNWQLTFDPDGDRPIALDGSSRVVVDRYLTCGAGRPHQVDGDLSDWPDLPFVCRQPAQVRVAPDSWQGVADGSFRFGVEYDENTLYVAAEITDDQVVADTLHLPWDQDGIEVRLDARPDPARSNERGGSESAFLLVAASPGATPAEMFLYQRGRLDSLGVTAVCLRQPGGYAAEIAIPRVWLDQQQGQPWSEFRFNLSVDDVDAPNGVLAQLCWRPDWRTPENYPGSGTFRRR